VNSDGGGGRGGGGGGGGEAPPSYTLVVIVEVKVNYSFYKTGYLNSGCGRNSSS